MNSEPTGALKGVRVVDFGHYLAGPLVAMFLADNGADVIHIDPPGGPRWNDPTNAALYRGKRTLNLDLKNEAGVAEARRLISSTDIVIENFRPGVMAALGLGPDSFAHENGGLIWCSLPGFASEDPRAGLRAWEGVVCSAAGLYPRPAGHDLSDGFSGDAPAFIPLPLASNFAAFAATHRIAGALLGRLQHGRGQKIELSLYEACFEAIGPYAEIPESRELHSYSFTARIRSTVMKTRRAADGSYVYFDTPLRGMQALLDRYLPEYNLLDIDDEALAQLERNLDELILQKNGSDWERIGQEEFQACIGLVQTTEEWLRDPHALESSTVIEVDDPELGPTVQPGFPVLLSTSMARVRWPRLAADSSPQTGIDWLEPARDEPRLPETATGLPLDGVRVLDLATLLAGPTTTRILAQYGADVIKIDRTGIASDDIDPLTDDVSAFYCARTVDAGKRMAFVDLKRDRGQDIVRTIISEMDVVHHNLTPSTAARLGLSAEDIEALNPSAILSTMSLHSHGGFRAAYRGHDFIAQMSSGIGTRMGGSADPQALSIVINDFSAGHLNAFGIMLALLHRHRTGDGQHVNQALSRSATLHQLPFMVGFAGRTWDEPSGFNAVGWHALDRLYQAGDGWFYLAHGAPADTGTGTLLDIDKSKPLLDGAGDVPVDQLEAWLESRFAETSVDECVAALLGAGFSAHRYVTLPELIMDDYVTENELLAIVEHPGIGRALGLGIRVLGLPSGASAEFLAARQPGMDTIEVLTEFGFGNCLGELIQDHVIGVGESPVLKTTRSRGYWTVPRRLTLMIPPDRLAAIARRIANATPSRTYHTSKPALRLSK